jgi:hypothetical protein
MDNKKGKKGKLFFSKYFLIIYHLIILIVYKIFMTEMVTDNAKGKKR